MQAKADIQRIEESISLYLDWAVIRNRIKRIATKERVIDIVLVASALAVLGVVIFSLSNALQNCTITGVYYF